MLDFYLVSTLKILGVLTLIVLFLFGLFWAIQAIRYYIHWFRYEKDKFSDYDVSWTTEFGKRFDTVCALSAQDAIRRAKHYNWIPSDSKIIVSKAGKTNDN